MTNITTLPKEFKWCTFDISADSTQITSFLNSHYRDVKNNWTRCFTEEYLKWYLTNSCDHIILGIKLVETNKIVGLITATFNTYCLSNESPKIIPNVDFICVHKQLRNKKMFNKLFNKMVTECKTLGFNNIFYKTNKDTSPNTCFYKSHTSFRPLNGKKLTESKYTVFSNRLSLDHVNKANKTISTLCNKNFIKLTDKHLSQVYNLYNDYIEKYSFYQIFTFDQFKQTFFNNNFVESFVLVDEDDTTHVIDFISYQKVLFTNTSTTIKCAYLYCYTSDEETAYRLIHDAIVMAYKNNVDIFYTHDLMEHTDVLPDLYFIKNNKTVHYHQHNHSHQNALLDSQLGVF